MLKYNYNNQNHRAEMLIFARVSSRGVKLSLSAAINLAEITRPPALNRGETESVAIVDVTRDALSFAIALRLFTTDTMTSLRASCRVANLAKSATAASA